MNLNQNYYEIFGLPLSYDLDISELGDRYLELQKELHPDRFAAASDQEKRLSMQWTTLVNTAHQVLKDPLARAVYLLELKGGVIAENPQLPGDFLMQQIELREQLEDIEEGTGDLDKLDAFKTEIRQVMSEIQGKFSMSIENDLANAELLVYELQFLSKLLASALHVEEKLLDY